MPEIKECPNCKGTKLEKTEGGFFSCLDDKCGITFKLKDGDPKPAGKSKLDEHEERIKRLEEGKNPKKEDHTLW